MRWFKPGLWLSVFLCLWSTKLYSLFSSEFLFNGGVLEQGSGYITCLETYEETNSHKNQFEWAASYLSGMIVRDRFALNVPVLSMTFGLDTAFIPGFTEYNDLGGEESAFPFGAAFRLEKYFIFNQNFLLKVSGYIGGEEIGVLQNELLYQLGATFTWDISDKFSTGIEAGYSDQKALRIQAGLGWRIIEKLRVVGAFELNGSYKTVKLGTIISLNSRFDIALGGYTTLEYSGWKLTSGCLVKDILLKNTSIDLGLAVEYTRFTGFEFTMNFIFN